MKTDQHTFGPYVQLLEHIRRSRIESWSSIERDFIDATSAFDTEYKSGERDSGWYQSKARYFNDFIVELLSNSSGKAMARRANNASMFVSNVVPRWLR